jgi:hypothetical protein
MSFMRGESCSVLDSPLPKQHASSLIAPRSCRAAVDTKEVSRRIFLVEGGLVREGDIVMLIENRPVRLAVVSLLVLLLIQLLVMLG